MRDVPVRTRCWSPCYRHPSHVPSSMRKIVCAGLVLLAIVWPFASPSGEPDPGDSQASDTTEHSGGHSGPGEPDPLLLLLRDPAVHVELDLTAHQAADLMRLVDRVDQPLWRLRDRPTAEVAEEVQQHLQVAEDGLLGILDEGQRERLAQLRWQAKGFRALLDPDLQRRLGLADSQAGRIARLLERTARALAAERSRSGAGREDRIKQIRAQERAQVLKLLSAPQRRELAACLGKEFDFSRLRCLYARAPEFAGITAWLNGEPLKMADLQGRVVVLHFWAYG